MSPSRYLGRSEIPIRDRITKGPRLASPQHLLCNSSPRPRPWGFLPWTTTPHWPQRCWESVNIRVNLFGGIFRLNTQTDLCFKHDSNKNLQADYVRNIPRMITMNDWMLWVLILAGCHNKLHVNVYHCQTRAKGTVLTVFSFDHTLLAN